MGALKLFVNTSAQTLANALVRSVTDMTPISLPQLVLGDNRDYELYLVDGTGNYSSFSGDGSYIPSIAIGQCGYPTGGTYTLTFSGHTTSALAWNASPSAVQAALQALVSIGSGNCAVAGVAGEWLTVTFIGALANSTQPAITMDFSLLTPPSTIQETTVVAGGGGLNCVQLLAFALNPVSFSNTWSTITNGWTGTLSTATLAIIEQFAAAGGVLNQTFQVTVDDPVGNARTYLQIPVTVECTIVNPSSFAGNYAVTLATQAALNAAVLGLNNFTREALTSSLTGNTNITPQATSRHHTAVVTVSGSAGTRTLSVLTSNSPNAGDTVLIVLLPGSTSGVIIAVHNATSGGTLLTSYTTDTASQLQAIILGFNGTAWQLESDSTQMLPKSGNLAGLANTIQSKANLLTLMSRLTAKSANFTVAASDEGTLFQVDTSGGSVVATIPAASTAGSGFLVALQKTDSTANTITTSPATTSVTTNGQVVVLASNGTSWYPVLFYNPTALQPTVAQTVLNWSFITDIGGSSATSLNYQPTASGAMPVNAAVLISYSGKEQFWQLQAGTTATGLGVQRPLDFDSTFNPQVWVQILGIVGNPTGVAAGAGSIGEVKTSLIAQGSGVSMTSATPAQIATITLTTGDWDVWGQVNFFPAGSTTMSQFIAAIDTTTANLPGLDSGKQAQQSLVPATGTNFTLPVQQFRVLATSSTPIFLNAQTTFAVSTMVAGGFISARRRA